MALGSPQRAQRSGDQLRASGSMLDLVGVGLAVKAIMNHHPLLGVFAADLLVGLGRRRCGPRPELNKKSVGLRS
jgi:hypothetical protein